MEINWPDPYIPENSAVHVVNSLHMSVAPEAAWNCLVKATDWPNWYEIRQMSVFLIKTKPGSIWG